MPFFDLERQRDTNILTALADRLDASATRIRCSNNSADGEKAALALRKESGAVRRAIKRLAPEQAAAE